MWAQGKLVFGNLYLQIFTGITVLQAWSYSKTIMKKRKKIFISDRFSDMHTIAKAGYSSFISNLLYIFHFKTDI